MNRILITAVLGLSLAAATAVTAQDQKAAGADPAGAAPPAPQAAPAPVKKERRICKEIDSTGSRVGGTNVCLTKAEWDARAARDSRSADAIQRNNLTVGSNPDPK